MKEQNRRLRGCPNHSTTYKIRKDEPGKVHSERKIAESSAALFEAYSPSFYSVYTDNKGRIYVQTNKTQGQSISVARQVDIFSKEGYYLYKASLPHYTYVIRDGFLFAYVLDSDSMAKSVNRYIIKNWKQIEEGVD